MFFLGAIVKAKIEMLLKVLSFHLQLKFFAIALASLVINLARFWIDVKKQPQKVSETSLKTFSTNRPGQLSTMSLTTFNFLTFLCCLINILEN